MSQSKIVAANNLFINAHKAIASLDFERSIRTSVALSLLTASRDHGNSILLLIDTEPNAHGASALALLRTQLDTLLRGCFFADEATDMEIDFFVKKDEMPKRNGDKISPNRLAIFAKHYLDLDPNDQLFENSVKSIWKGLHGMVHGGRATLNLYDKGSEIAFELTDEGLDFTIRQSATLTLFCAVAFMRTSRQDNAGMQSFLEPLLESLKQFETALTHK
jgi:hypothetical protein